MKQRDNNLRGSILVFTMLVLSILLSVAISSTSIVILGKNSSRATEKSAVSFQVADGAVENILKRIYKNNDDSLEELAGRLYKAPGGNDPACANGVISGQLPTGAGTYRVALFDTTGAPMRCNGGGYNNYDEWRSKLARIVSSGSYAGVTRAIDVAVEPAPCGGTTTVADADGNDYDTIEIGNQCWMKQNMNVGTRFDLAMPTPQVNNPDIEKYCYNDDWRYCDTDTNSENFPDGGLYTWDEAMQYTNTEKAQGICPNNWHIPTWGEFYELVRHYNSGLPVAPPVMPGVSLGDGTASALLPLLNNISRFNFNYAGAVDQTGTVFTGLNVYGNMHLSPFGASIIHSVRSGSIREDITPGVKLPGAASVRCLKD